MIPNVRKGQIITAAWANSIRLDATGGGVHTSGRGVNIQPVGNPATPLPWEVRKTGYGTYTLYPGLVFLDGVPIVGTPLQVGSDGAVMPPCSASNFYDKQEFRAAPNLRLKGTIYTSEGSSVDGYSASLQLVEEIQGDGTQSGEEPLPEPEEGAFNVDIEICRAVAMAGTTEAFCMQITIGNIFLTSGQAAAEQVPLAQFGSGVDTVPGKIAGVIQQDGAYFAPYIVDGVLYIHVSTTSPGEVPLAQYNRDGILDTPGKIAGIEFSADATAPQIVDGFAALPLADNPGSSVDQARPGGMLALVAAAFGTPPTISNGTGYIPVPTFDPTYFTTTDAGEVTLKEAALDALADEAVARIQLNVTAEGDLTPTEFSASLGTLQAQAAYSGAVPESGLTLDSSVRYV